MPKGYQKYNKYETALLKAAKTMRKAFKRIEDAAAELEQRPDPVVEPKAKKPRAPKKARQLRLPGTAGSRKAAKAPAKPRKSRAQRS